MFGNFVPLNDNNKYTPGKPESVKSSRRSITIQWHPPPSLPDNFQNYEVRYKENHPSVTKWESLCTSNASCKLELNDLKENTVYQCKVRTVAENEDGPFSVINDNISTSGSKTTTLIQPTHLNVSKVTSNSTTIEWERPSLNDTIDCYEIKFMDTATKKWTSCCTVKDETKFTIENLSPQQCYDVKVRAKVNDEDGPFSETLQIRTKENHSRKQPGVPEVLYVTDHEISLKWDKPTENSEYINHYDVRYIQPNVNSKWIQINTTGSDNTITVKNLREKTKYEFIVRAVYNDGSGPFSDPVSIATKTIDTVRNQNNNPSKPMQDTPLAPGKPFVTRATSNSIVIQWDAPEGTTTVDNYEVKYKDCNQSIIKWESVFTDKNERNLTIQKLSEHQYYVVKVRAIVNGEDGPFSETIQIRTKENHNKKPVVPEAFNVTDHDITLKWQKPTEICEDINYFEVRYRQTNLKPKWNSIMISGSANTITVQNLKEKTEYEFIVRAVYNDAFGPLSDPVCIATKSIDKQQRNQDDNPPQLQQKTPGTPGKPFKINATSNSIVIQWDAPDDATGTVDCYEVRYQECNQSVKKWKSVMTENDETEKTITGLNDSCCYEFKVRAIIDNNDGPLSLSNTIWTLKSTTQVPGIPEIVYANHCSLSLKWKQPVVNLKALSNYEVRFKSTNSRQNWATVSTDGTKNEIVLQNLNENTTYEIKVRAVFDDTDGPFSEPLITKTKSSPLTVIECLPPIVETVTEKSVTLRIETHLQISEEDYFEIQYNKSGLEGTRITAVHRKTKPITIQELESNVAYEFKVRAVVKGQQHPFSSLVLVKTLKIAIGKANPPAIAGITSDSISLTLTLPQNIEKLYAFEVRYKKSDDNIAKWESTVSQALDSVTVFGLQPNTEYMFQVRPMYEKNSVPFSEPAVFARTKELSNEPGVPKVVERTDSSITIKWKPPAAANSIDFYDIRYRKASTNSWQNITSETTDVTITDLQKETTYEFKVRASFGETDGKFSEICKVQTKKQDDELLAKKKPGIPQVTEIKVDRIALTWQAPQTIKKPDNYEIWYCEESNKCWVCKTVVDNMDMISDLKGDTTYIFKIRAGYGNSKGPCSELCTVKTSVSRQLNSTENQPCRPDVKLLSFDSISFTWKAPANLEKLEQYEACIQKANSDKKIVIATSNTEALFENLESSTEYEFKVRAIYDQGNGPYSTAIKQLTKDKPLKQPGKPETIKTSPSSISLRWNTSNFDKTTVAYHEIKYQEVGGKSTTVQSDTSQCEMTFPNLKSSASYEFMVRTVFTSGDKSAWSPKSEKITTQACFVDNIAMAGQSHDSMVIVWKPPEFDGDVKHYVVDYRELKSQSWYSVPTHSKVTKITINKLKASTQYEVRIKVVQSNSEGEYSSIKNGFFTSKKPVAETPGTPSCSECTSKSVTLTWDQCELSCFECYEIRYRDCSTISGKWLSVSTLHKLDRFTVPDLKGGTDYEFKVAAVVNGEASHFSNISMKISTKLSIARSIELSEDALIEEGPPKRYKLPVKETTSDQNAKTRKCLLDFAPYEQTGRYDKMKARVKYAYKKVKSKFTGSKNLPPRSVNVNEKTIMLVGSTGSGKSTLIDGMINYITDISWEDDFRFSLIDITQDEKKNVNDQTKSQTEWITTYRIPYFDGGVLPFNLNIIDTPGFGDTRGIERDKYIVSQVDQLFQDNGENGIRLIDAVCFVTQSPLARLTPTQKYIFDSILAMFGKDISSNIFVLITFSDGKTPPVLDALHKANVPFSSSFKFNNSALFEPNIEVSKDNFAKCFWKMGEESFKLFFSKLQSVETKSLQLTADVLRTRMTLEVTIEGLQKQVTDGMNQLNTIRQEGEILKRHKTEIEANKNFHYTVDEAVMTEIKLKPGEYVTNCLKCNISCHFPCQIAEDEKKKNCKAMDKTENCNVCPTNCHWTQHRNAPFRLETVKREVSKTYEELKEKYEIAQKGAKSQTDVLCQIKKAFINLKKDVYDKINKVRQCINDLEQFALKPNPLSDIDYIDLLIRSEETEVKYGWQDRVKLLKNFRKEAEVIQKVKKSNKYTPFDQEDEIWKEFDITEESL